VTTPPVRPAARADVMTGAATELDALPAAADSAWLPATRVIEPRASRLRADRLGSALISPLNGVGTHGKELTDCAPGPQEFAAAIGLAGNLAAAVRPRVAAKLDAEPVEDLRLDREDGYHLAAVGAAEDADAQAAARHLAAAVAVGNAAPFTGLRCKNLEPATRGRGIRTLDVFLAELLALALTLPKVTSFYPIVGVVDEGSPC